MSETLPQTTRTTHEADAPPPARPASAHPAYRPDIDGLRAIAVLSVVGYHAFPARVPGGFVGVDVFFVISGFLISTILFGNLERNRFSFVGFYVRRIRRIFPALAVVLATTFACGWWTLMADELAQVGKHVAAGAGFVSNLVLWSESGYFDAAAEAKPLLHLWSLGIEEQFYIAWPLLLALFWRLRINLLVLTLVTAALSFAGNLWLAHVDAVADFYSPLSRFWELALGATLAHVALFEPAVLGRVSPPRRDAMSFAGFALIAIGVATTRASNAFPGWIALLPTVGATLLIAAGSQAWVNRTLLSHCVMVWIGLVSFPLYLWHWPILSYIHILDAERPSRVARLAAVAAALLLAWLTYRWVEGPLRHAGQRRWLPGALLAVVGTIGVIGFAGYRNDGFPERASARAAIVNTGELGQDAFYADLQRRFHPCTDAAVVAQAERWNDVPRCFQTDARPADFVIVGDSHAEHLFVGLAEALPGHSVAYYTRSAAPMPADAEFRTIYERVVADPRIRTVAIAAWWGLRLPQAGGDAVAALDRTVGALLAAGKTVFLVDDTPNFSFSPRLCKYAGTALRRHRCDEDAAFFGDEWARDRAALDDVARRHPGVRVLEPARAFCDERACTMARDGRLLFRDSDHLGPEGSRDAARRMLADEPALR